ncbi:PAS domain-containing protein [Rhizobacter sp. J219]|uniref:hybrid sensor histidine kinase/response regulator n=1 Tax=Rhizobacter sp. J219 TaxID=2898430 RepID=UPI002150A7CB|nr:PAS domain-containing protein [Rhizobacter sp. J219]MCR5884828.1 PAS domain-containing protein [Rhizobacter sp. J219]
MSVCACSQAYGVLDTPPEARFDALARLACRLCDTPMAVITLVDDHRQWFKAEIGLGVRETPRAIAFCAHTIEGPGLFQVPDTHADPRFVHNPLVTGAPGLRFYAGVPLQVDGGQRLGALAVLDRRPRQLTPEQQADLQSLAQQVVLVLEEQRLRRLAEAASEETKHQSDSLLAIAGRVARLGAWELDIAGQKVVWSDVVADIHGMPRGFSPDLDNALGFYVEPDRSTLTASVTACLQHGTPFDHEMVLQPAGGGAPRWVRSIGEAVRDAEGRITHLRGACQDITERKSHVLQIQHLAEQLSATFESIPDPFLAVGADGQVLLVNAAFEQLVQRERAGILGHSLGEVLPPSVIEPPLLDRCAEAMRRQQPLEFEATERRSRRRFEVRLFPVDNGLTLHARDITEREATLAQLRLLDTCVRYLNDAVVITDANVNPPGPTVLFANQAIEGLCGWQPAQLVGSSPRRLQGPMTQRDRLDALRDAISRGLPFETEAINYRNTGETYWVELKLSPIQDEEGRCTHFIAVERDITERKLAEAHREALERQLRQAQKMESIGTLAGGIAHDFNNILGAILGNVALVRDALVPLSPGHAPLGTIEHSAQRARSLVQQILAFGRQQATQRMRQPLRPLVDEAARLLQATLPASVVLRMSGTHDEVFAEVDGHQLQQVLINLCTNAWHALPARGGLIEIGLDTEAPASQYDTLHYAHLWVKDDGCGMAPDVQARVFEPFFTTKPVGQGTGLGLSAAHGIVEAHGGRMDVESEPGRGSTFHVYLPVSDPADPTLSEKAIAAADRRSLKSLKVLCVDDDPVMLTTMQALLEREGCVVDAQASPQQALEQLRALRGDTHLLVTDFNMPLMDGMALVREAKRLNPELPVVMASGFLSDKLCEQATLLGVDVLVQKERTVEDLVAAVREAVARASLRTLRP